MSYDRSLQIYDINSKTKLKLVTTIVDKKIYLSIHAFKKEITINTVSMDKEDTIELIKELTSLVQLMDNKE